ncbi:hypothetical protein [Neogemmobacter tilapiae]|uniref:ATP-grasp domain-containing protein n=1 Tax=Neogemmobacter tilapiae TaxID=875041 RepID=A0A918TDU4_9RHOB|nr:hypothetical protein [Gemmobacter tilapiae]GHC43501.1 hypothetical protein GCM10007315_00620 [Gemmobacter tilapiae]
MTSFLEPSLRTEQMFPAKTAFMARTSLEKTRLLGFRPVNQDTVTSLLFGLMSGMATIRHRSGATPAILDVYRRMGMRVDEDLHVYESGEQAEALADQLISKGHKLLYPYPLSEGRFAESGLLIPSALWEQLNAKDRLADLVPPENLPGRRIMTLAQAAAHVPNGPVWLKAAGMQATGWGYAVRPCVDLVTYHKGLNDLAALPGVTNVILEDDVPVHHCWGASIAVNDTDVAFAGWAEQEFASPGKLSGSVINPQAPFPADGEALSRRIGETARKLGFRGLAGFDIGQMTDGRLIVFDPNFRFTSSTTLAMFYPAMSKRSGLIAARGFHFAGKLPLADMIDRFLPAAEEGWFLPTRLLDGSLLPAAQGQSMVTGIVMGASLDDTARRAARLAGNLDAE